MSVTLHLDKSKIKNKIDNNRVGLFVATSVKKQLNPFTPRNTGQLQDTAEVTPWTITYIATSEGQQKSYASAVYHNNYNFQHINPYSTNYWDKAMEQAGKLAIVYRETNTALEQGRL